MNLIKIYLSVICFFCLLSSSYAQWEVSGKVIDSNNDPLLGVTILVKGSTTGTITDIKGAYTLSLKDSSQTVLVFKFVGYMQEEVQVNGQKIIDLTLKEDTQSLDEVVVIKGNSRSKRFKKSERKASSAKNLGFVPVQKSVKQKQVHTPQHFKEGTAQESYAEIQENGFMMVSKNPLSTFSVDVDKASYTNVRRYLNMGQRPPVDAVRIEELINYFDYEYPEVKSRYPYEIHSEVSDCPWNQDHRLMMVGLQGKKLRKSEIPPSNLVFLLDVSGSMGDFNKLPLLKKSFPFLLNNLSGRDKVSIVVYAGAAGVVLPPTPADQKETIYESLNNLVAGGSTAGGRGIELAYKLAEENFIQGGNNRVILATDGDFNVGVSNTSDLKKLIEKKRKTGIYLTCLGFGMGNYKDDKVEGLAQAGNGNYAYIDQIEEAQKVLGKEFAGTLYTIAKDVKLQVEFNPAFVQGYRLIGYENRLLNEEDFDDDQKDAGEMGAGHTVTALYEIIPVGVKSKYVQKEGKLKYQQKSLTQTGATSGEWATVNTRYKHPREDESVKFEEAVMYSGKSLDEAHDRFKFASSVALFGMLLRDSKYIEDGNWKMVARLAKEGKGKDDGMYKTEFMNLVESVKKGWTYNK